MQPLKLICFITLFFTFAQARAEDAPLLPVNPPSAVAPKAEQTVSPVTMTYDSRTQTRSPVRLTVKTVIDGSSLLTTDGKIFSLTGLDIPDDDRTPVQARDRLSALTKDAPCTLYQTRKREVGRVDRMGHLLGHLTCGKDNIWLQGQLVAEGLARVRSTPETAEQVEALYKLETAARTAKKGLWSLPAYAPLTPATAGQRTDSFVIVEGAVYQIEMRSKMTYLNFSRDRMTDFTIAIPTPVAVRFSKNHISLQNLRGKTVRVRGWVRNYNGPYLELDHPEQLEIIGGAAPAETEERSPHEDPSAEIPEKQTEFMHSISHPKPPAVEKPEPAPTDADKAAAEKAKGDDAVQTLLKGFRGTNP